MGHILPVACRGLQVLSASLGATSFSVSSLACFEQLQARHDDLRDELSMLSSLCRLLQQVQQASGVGLQLTLIIHHAVMTVQASLRTCPPLLRCGPLLAFLAAVLVEAFRSQPC
jgi:hypothetical protein